MIAGGSKRFICRIDRVWNKARIVEVYNADIIRKDTCGAWIVRNQYGIRDSIFGWEIDHVYPESLGGGDDMDNLRAMQWENNVSKGDDFPSYKSRVQAEGSNNVYKEEQYTINDDLRMKLEALYDI